MIIYDVYEWKSESLFLTQTLFMIFYFKQFIITIIVNNHGLYNHDKILRNKGNILFIDLLANFFLYSFVSAYTEQSKDA